LSERMMPADGVKMIVNGKINPALYNVENYKPEKVLAHAKKMAAKYGLNPAAIKREDILPELDGIINSAVTRRYKLLRTEGDQMGRHNLDTLLDKDEKFQSFYKEYTDPLYENDRLTNIKQKPAFIKKLPTGWEVNEERGVITGVPDIGMQALGIMGNDVETDSGTGLRYTEDFLGRKYYLDMPVMNAWWRNTPAGMVHDMYRKNKWEKEKGIK